MCSNEICRKFHIGKPLPDMPTFTISIGLQQGDASSTLLFRLSLKYGIMELQQNQERMDGI